MLLAKRQSSLAKSVLGLNGPKLRVSSHRSILIQFPEESVMAAKPACSWAGVRFASFSSFPYLLTKTAWICSWSPDYPVLCLSPNKIIPSHPIPSHASTYFVATENPSRGQLRLHLHASRSLCLWNAKLKPRKQSSLPLGRYFCQAVVLSSPCLGLFPPDWISHQQWHLSPQYLCCKYLYWWRSIPLR